MKKYLITQTQLDLLANLLTYIGIPNDLNSLTPIEPLSEIQARDIYQQTTGFDMNFGHGSDIALLDFAKAIERHIIGSDE